MSSEAADNILKDPSVLHQLCISFFMGVVANKSFNVPLYENNRLLPNKFCVLLYLSLLVLEGEYNIVGRITELTI